MKFIVEHLINGKRSSEVGARQHDVYNPATGQVTKQVSLASKTVVEEAISAAEAAFPTWSNTPPSKRAQIMYRLKYLLEENSDTICRMITDEHGKVYNDAKGELTRAIENVEFACSIPSLMKGEHTKNVGTNVDSWSEMQPIGVTAGITPFNFPAMVPFWMWPLAVAVGNTFILKPSELTPSTSIYMAELAHEAGLPPGVLNVVNGDKEAVDAILEDPRVQAVSFVGSTTVAEYIYTTGTANGKRVQALGGAKNHAIVMPDADMDNAVSALMGAAYGSSGERCMALSIAVTVGEETGDIITRKLSAQLEALKVGPGLSDNDMGPLVTRAHFNKVKGYVDLGVIEGAELVVDGRNLVVEGHDDGFYLGGCLFDKVTPEMKIYKDEIFGPVLGVVRVETQQEAMDLINAHQYGNGSCIFTRDGESARFFTDNIKVGMVGVNVPLPVPVAYHSFGGWKRSLFGDLCMYGPDGVRFWTLRKTITQRWPSSDVRAGASFYFA